MSSPDRERGIVRRIWTTGRDGLGRPWFLFAIGPLLAVLALFLAYRSPVSATIDLGTSYALPYLTGFYAPERTPAFDYAFSAAHSQVTLPGVGSGPALVEIRIGGGPAGVRQMISANGLPLGEVSADDGIGIYAFALPAQAMAGGSLELAWDGKAVSTPQDRRELGLAVDWVEWTPLPGLILPDVWQVLSVALAALAVYLLSRQLALSAPLSAALSSLLVLLIALGIALARLYVTIFIPRLLVLLVALTMLLPLFRRGTRAVLRWTGCEPRPAIEAWLWRVTVLAAIIKLGGVLYPQLIVLDVTAHASRVYLFLGGNTASLFLPSPYSLLGKTVGLEGGQFPYSPLFHVLSFPLTLLPMPLPLAMGLLNGILDVARNLLIFIIAARLVGRQWVGVWAALFYAFLPAPYYLLSWGNYPTQLGLWGALLVIAFLAVGYDRLGQRPTFGWWVAVLVFAILSYTVVGLLTATMLLLLVIVERLLAAGPAQRRRLGAVLAGLVLAEMLIFLIYHSSFVEAFARETLPAIFRLTPSLETSQVPPVGAWESLSHSWQAYWIFVQNHITDLGVVFTMVGVTLLLAEPARRRWRPLVLAWFLIFPLFALFSGLVADMVGKHIFFLLPLLCIGAGTLAERLWRRGLAGRATVLLYTALMVWLSLSHWVDLILVKRH